MKTKLMVAIFVFGIASVGMGTTQALLGDTEVSGNNIFQAGSLDIQVGWEESLNSDIVEIQNPNDNPGPIFNLTNIQRGDSGEATIEIKNNANPGYLWFTANQTGNKENGVARPEEDKKQKTYYEVDFVEGPPLKMQNGESYKDQHRLIRRAKGKTLEQPDDRESPEQAKCVPQSQGIEVKEDYAHVKFDIKNKDKCGTGTDISLVSYTKNYSEWTEEREGEKLYDTFTKTFEPYTGENRIKVKLPPENYSHQDSKTKNLASDEFEDADCKDETPEEGELGENLIFTVWHDNGDNVLDEDESVIFEGTAHQLDEFMNGEGKLLDYNPDKSGVQPIPGNDRKFIGFKWKLPEDTGCEVQTDSKTFDFKFELRQARHNGNPFLKTFFFGDEEITRNNLFKAGNFTDLEKKDRDYTKESHEEQEKTENKNLNKENTDYNKTEVERQEKEKEEVNSNLTTEKDTFYNQTKSNKLSKKLLAHWKLDKSTYEVNNSASDNYDAKNRGATRAVPGKVNNSFKFDGSDHLKVQASEDFRLEQGTVSFWVKTNDKSSNWMFARGKDGCEEDCGHLSIAHDSSIVEDKLGVRLQNNGTDHRLIENEEVESFEPDEWNHVALSFGDKGMKMYINNKLHDSNQRRGGIEGNNLPIMIGSRYDGKKGLKGKMDEIRIHNYQLNRSEITQIREKADKDLS